jgi:hypothetical protein
MFCSAIALLLYLRYRSAAWLCGGCVLLVAALMLAESESGRLRIMTMSKTNIGAFQQAFTPFNLPQSPPVIIAYSGVNIPYMLLLRLLSD